MVGCPTIRTTNDVPITWSPSLDALGLVPFQVNAHHHAGQNYVKHGDEFVENFGETRDERLREFHEMNATPVVGLAEGRTLWCESGAVSLAAATARVVRRGVPAVDVEPGVDLARMAGFAGPAPRS